MAIPSDWQTLKMRPATGKGYGSLRVPMLNVFFPNRDELPPESQWLRRTVFAYVTRGRVNPLTEHRLAFHLAIQLGCNLSDLTVEEVDEVEAHFLVIFPDTNLRDRALAMGRLTLREIDSDNPQMEVRLVGWRPEYGTHYAPVGEGP